MAANIKTRLSVQEYLAWEAENEIKREYIDGEVYRGISFEAAQPG